MRYIDLKIDVYAALFRGNRSLSCVPETPREHSIASDPWHQCARLVLPHNDARNRVVDI